AAMTHDWKARDHEYLAGSLKKTLAHHDAEAQRLVDRGIKALRGHGKEFAPDVHPLILSDALDDHGQAEHAKAIRNSEHVSPRARREPWQSYVRDQSGHEHKSAGPGGGQFAAKSGGDTLQAKGRDTDLVAKVLRLARKWKER